MCSMHKLLWPDQEKISQGGGGGGGGGAKIGFQIFLGAMHLATLMHSNHVICIVGVSRG